MLRQQSRSTANNVPAVTLLKDAYVAAQLRGDRREAMRLVMDDGLARGVPVPALYLEVVASAQRDIGVMWQENRISIADEHLATAISQLVIAQLYTRLPRRRAAGKRVLIACVPDELHELGARITADFFEMDGFEVRYLGASVPAESLADMAAAYRPHVVGLSVSMSFHVDQARACVAALREALGDAFLLAVGGRAFEWSPGLVSQFGAEIYGPDVRACVSSARQLLLQQAS